MSPNVSREYLNIGDGSFRDRGGYESSTGGWVAGGIGFLFLVFIIFGVAAFIHKGHDHSADLVRDNGRVSNEAALAAAYARGESNVREANLLTLAIANSDRVTQLIGEVREAAQIGRATTIEAAQDIVTQGRTWGFRSVDLVYPDPCRDRCGDGRGRGRGFDESARVRGSVTLPTATTPGIIEADIFGRGREC